MGASLHSSNDSGFSNEPPIAPEVDYSEDEASRDDSTPLAAGSPGGSPTGSPGSEERVLSSVKGWLLYKSALDLWDDVEAQTNRTMGRTRPPPPPRGPPPPRPSDPSRELQQQHAVSTLPSSAKMRGRPLVPPPPVPDLKGSVNGNVVKRTKSLLKFRRDNGNAVLEGMALWRHRSLVDVRIDGEDRRPSASSEEHSKTSRASVHTPLMKMKLVKIDIGEEKSPPPRKELINGHGNGLVNGHGKSSAVSGRERNGGDVEFVSVEEQTYSTLTKHGAAYFQKRVLERTKSAQQPTIHHSDDDEDPPYEDATEAREAVHEALTDKKREAARRAAAEAVRAAALRRQFGSGDRDRLLTLPSRTRRLSRTASQELPGSGLHGESHGIFQYGKTLQSRLKAPDRGSRFDRLSITTGNLCGPWYDMWGADASVEQKS